jgi:hypothetical protein
MGKYSGCVVDDFLLGREGGEEEMSEPVRRRVFSPYMCAFSNNQFMLYGYVLLYIICSGSCF